jgi:hypothetical protein
MAADAPTALQTPSMISGQIDGSMTTSPNLWLMSSSLRRSINDNPHGVCG